MCYEASEDFDQQVRDSVNDYFPSLVNQSYQFSRLAFEMCRNCPDTSTNGARQNH